MERTQLIEELQSKYPKMFLRTTEEFDGTKDGIWTNGEQPPVNTEGLPIFNYYAEDNKYNFGIEVNFSEYLDQLGWYCEWYDAGTIFITPN
jgi:hypothetical protein